MYIDNTKADRIIFQFKSLPEIGSICVYLPPSNSPYFSLDNVANISAQLATYPGKYFVITGDVNCHFSKIRSQFLENKTEAKSLSYDAVDRDKDPNAMPSI